MNSVLHNLDELNQALQQVASELVPTKRTNAEKVLVPLIRAAKRKCSNVLLHRAVIAGVDWNNLDDLGRISLVTGRTNELTIKFRDTSLTISHRGAVVDQVYVAFDGFIAGIANIMDTVRRLINIFLTLRSSHVVPTSSKSGTRWSTHPSENFSLIRQGWIGLRVSATYEVSASMQNWKRYFLILVLCSDAAKSRVYPPRLFGQIRLMIRR